jgi:co-chaperonin GroES (HSP10)
VHRLLKLCLTLVCSLTGFKIKKIDLNRAALKAMTKDQRKKSGMMKASMKKRKTKRTQRVAVSLVERREVEKKRRLKIAETKVHYVRNSQRQ